MNERVFIVEAKRTPIGKFLGSLYEASLAEVCVQLIKNGFENQILSDVEQFIMGNVFSAGLGQGIAKHISLRAGITGVGQGVPSYTVNMVCGSGMQAIINGYMEIQLGKKVVMCGGADFMSNIPFATDSYIRLGKKFGDFTMIDLMTHDGLKDAFSGVHMGVTAENISKQLNIGREEQDDYSYLTNQRAIAAVDSNAFADEIVPITLKDYRGKDYVFDRDEFPNRTSTREKLSALKPTFIKDGTGTVTAGNSSGINDGAAFLILASMDYCREHNIRPLAEIIETATVACDAQLMGLGPYYAINNLLSKTEINFKDIACFEINEAFAVQVLGCFHLLSEKYGVSVEEIVNKTNLYGSGIGLGHPLGASGARIATTLAHILKNKNMKYGIASLCIGGGMGAALLLQGVDNNEFIG